VSAIWKIEKKEKEDDKRRNKKNEGEKRV